MAPNYSYYALNTSPLLGQTLLDCEYDEHKYRRNLGQPHQSSSGLRRELQGA